MYERGVYEVWSMLWLSAYVKPESSLQAVRALVSLTLAVTLVTAPTHHHQSTLPSDQLSCLITYTTVERLGCVDLNIRVTDDWPWGCLGVIRPTLIFKWTKIPSLCDCGLIQNYECSVKNYHVHVLFLSVGLFWFTLQLAASLRLVVQDEW